MVERGAELGQAPLGHRRAAIVLDVRVAPGEEEVDRGLGLDHAAVVAVALRQVLVAQQHHLRRRQQHGQGDDQPNQGDLDALLALCTGSSTRALRSHSVDDEIDDQRGQAERSQQQEDRIAKPGAKRGLGPIAQQPAQDRVGRDVLEMLVKRRLGKGVDAQTRNQQHGQQQRVPAGTAQRRCRRCIAGP